MGAEPDAGSSSIKMKVVNNVKRIPLKELAKTRKVLLPIFKKDSVSEFANEILREDETLRRYLIANPSYRPVFEDKISETFKKYGKVLKGARLVDSWDRVTSSIGMAADAAGPITGGLGTLISAGEEVVETIPKAIYSIYYGAKTKDWKALPYFAAMEAASFIPFLGDAIDMSNIYVKRARKVTKEKVKKEMKKILASKMKSGLEYKVAA